MNPTIDFLVNYKGDASGIINAIKQARKADSDFKSQVSKLPPENMRIGADVKQYKAIQNAFKGRMMTLNLADPKTLTDLRNAFAKQRKIVESELLKTGDAGDRVSRAQMSRLNRSLANYYNLPSAVKGFLPARRLGARSIGKTDAVLQAMMGDTAGLGDRVNKANEFFYGLQLRGLKDFEVKKDQYARIQAMKEESRQALVSQKGIDAKSKWNRYAMAQAIKEERAQMKVTGDPYAQPLGMWGKFKAGAGEWWSSGMGKIIKNMAGFYGLYAIYSKLLQAGSFLLQQTFELQVSFARLDALAVGNGQKYDKLRGIVFGLGTAHGFMATEVAQAIKPLTQMGKTQEEIAMLTEKAMQVANLTGDSLAAVISSSVASMTNFDMTVKEQTELMDYWATLTSHYAVSIEQLAKGFEQGGETFKEFGFNARQVSAIMTILMEQERGKQAGVVRYLRLIMEQLPKEEVQGAIWKHMGVSVLNARGGQRDPWTIIKEMANAWQGLDNVQKTAFRNSLSNKSAMDAIYGVMNDWEKIQKAVNLGTDEGNKKLAEQSKIIEDTFIKRWESLKNVWVGLADTKLKDSVTFLTDFTRGLVELSVALGNTENQLGKWWERLKTIYKWSPLAAPQYLAEMLGTELAHMSTSNLEEGWKGLKQPFRLRLDEEKGSAAWQYAKQKADEIARNKAKPTPTTEGQVIHAETDADRAANIARQGLKDYETWKSLYEKTAKARENELKVADLEARTVLGYQVGINKQLIEEAQKRQELVTAKQSAESRLDELNTKRIAAEEYEKSLVNSIKADRDKATKQLEEINSLISAEQLKLAESKNALVEQNTVLRELGDTYRNMILDTTIEIIEKTQTWLDLNYKLRDLLSNIGNNVLKSVLDKMTGGFVDKLGNLGNLATMQSGKSATANVMGMGAVGIASAAGGYAYVKGKGWVPVKGAGNTGGLGFGDYASAGLMGAAIGSNRGTKGMAGGAIGSMAGMGIGLALGGPVGGQIGAVAGGWLGSLFGKPKKDETKTEEAIKSFSSTPSKIDVTNNELQIVNRNLVALKEKFDPYPFRSSAYFTSHMNAGIGSGQWGNLTIHVNGATDPITTAKAVSQAIAGYSMQGAV
jgi:TP901 family phage tail tape measure protein